MNAPGRPAARRATNLHLEADLVEEARRLGVNLSRAAEAGLRRAVAEEAARRWREENAEGIRQMNAWVEKHGLPLAKHRVFMPDPE
jgi:antitoxin CcdA